MQNEWRGFQRGSWEEEINVRDFIQKNYTPYDGDDSFLEGPTFRQISRSSVPCSRTAESVWQ